MTMLKSEPAICKNCGNKQNFTKVISWNVCLDPKYPANNRCRECGTEIKYEDIDMSICSPFHRREVRLSKIHERFSKKKGYKNKEICFCSQEELEAVENELISEGLITTKEEEKEYSGRYFKELEEKLFGSDPLKKFK